MVLSLFFLINLAGDEIEFIYNQYHNVVEYNSELDYNECNENYKVLADDGPFTLLLDKPGDLFIACTIMKHCQYGQKVLVSVLEAEDRVSNVFSTYTYP